MLHSWKFAYKLSVSLAHRKHSKSLTLFSDLTKTCNVYIVNPKPSVYSGHRQPFSDRRYFRRWPKIEVWHWHHSQCPDLLNHQKLVCPHVSPAQHSNGTIHWIGGFVGRKNYKGGLTWGGLSPRWWRFNSNYLRSQNHASLAANQAAPSPSHPS